MRLLAATGRLSGLNCSMCKRVVRVGDYVLWHKVPGVFTSDADVVVHATCMRTRVAGVPEGGKAKPKAKVNSAPSVNAHLRLMRERARIVSSGKVFR